MKKGLKINVATQTIEVVEVDNMNGIYPLLGEECVLFECPVQFDNKDTLYCDEESLYHTIEGGFKMKDWSYPIVGNAILLQEDGDVKTTVEELTEMVIWVSKSDAIKWANNFQ